MPLLVRVLTGRGALATLAPISDGGIWLVATERIQRRIGLLEEVDEAADQEDSEAVHRLTKQVFDLAPGHSRR